MFVQSCSGSKHDRGSVMTLLFMMISYRYIYLKVKLINSGKVTRELFVKVRSIFIFLNSNFAPWNPLAAIFDAILKFLKDSFWLYFGHFFSKQSSWDALEGNANVVLIYWPHSYHIQIDVRLISFHFLYWFLQLFHEQNFTRKYVYKIWS